MATLPYSGSNIKYTVYFGDKLIAEWAHSSTFTLMATDRLGSVRANSNNETFDYLPYGEERAVPTTPNDRVKFGTYFRDSATYAMVSQDYADQRYYNPGYGRFNSPDPSKGSNPADPASWNKYAYTRGDPVNRLDPNGLEDCEATFCTTVYSFSTYSANGDIPGLPMIDFDMNAYTQVVGLLSGIAAQVAAAMGAVRKFGPPSGQQFAGFNQALDDLSSETDCATLIAGKGDASVIALQTDLWNANVTVGTSSPGNLPAVITPLADGGYSYTFQNAYTMGGNIELNGNYFPDPTKLNIALPDGTSTSLLNLVNMAYGSSLDATQFGTFVFLHELRHIAGGGPEIDTTESNKDIISKCIK